MVLDYVRSLPPSSDVQSTALTYIRIQHIAHANTIYIVCILCAIQVFFLLLHIQVQEQLITLCLRANSSSCDLNVASCSFITSVLTLATFSPTSRNWSWKFAATLYSHLPKGREKKRKSNVKSTSRKTGHTRVAAAFCKPAIPGRLLMLSGGVIYLHKQAQFAPQKF